MSLINHRAREIHVKIVYYGPGLGGKTTNVRMLHERLPADRRGRMVTIATEQERTLFFDFMPVDLGPVNGFTTRFHLYTVPGQIYYSRSRRAVLQGVDGIVFVADSQPDREQDNVESLEDLRKLLGHVGLGAAQIARLPRVIQYNKRDVTGAIPVERLRAMLNPEGLPEYEAVAIEGKGVSETMRAIAKGVLGRITGLSALSPRSTVVPVGPPQPAVASVARPQPALVPVPSPQPTLAPVGAPQPALVPVPPPQPALAPVGPTQPAVAPIGPPQPAPTVIVPAVGPVRLPMPTPLAPASPRATPSPRRGLLRRIARTRA